MIKIGRAEKALKYLATTDEEFAVLKVDVERLHYLLKRKESIEFLSCDGTVAERQHTAKTAPEVVQAEKELTDAMVALEKIRAKRATEELVWRTWQTLEVSRRAGQ